MKHRFESLIDTNHDGRATAEEMEAYLRKFKPSVTDEEVAAFIRRRDIDGECGQRFLLTLSEERKSGKAK